MIKLLALALLFATASYGQFYVSPTGNDGNPGTLMSPFLTLPRCQTAMQSGSKVCNIRAGTYILGADLDLAGADSGETWQRYQCETPIIDGAGTHNIVLSSGSFITSMTFTGLTWQNFNPNAVLSNSQAGTFVGGNYKNVTWNYNTFTSCQHQCIMANFFGGPSDSGTGIVITNNTVNGQIGSEIEPWSIAPGVSNNFAIMLGSPSGILVQHNAFNNLQGGAVQFLNGGLVIPGMPVNNVMDSNYINRAMQGPWCVPPFTGTGGDCGDSGALYMAAAGFNNGSGNQITNNVILNNNPNGSTFIKGIYLDDDQSFVTVLGNITQIGNGIGLHIHGGNNITVQNNIWDMSNTGTVIPASMIYYQGNSGFGMAGNTFMKNLVYKAGSENGLILWFNNGGESNPSDSNNLYYATGGGTWTNPSGGINDTAPVFQNPLFTNPASSNYVMPPTSPAFTVVGFSPLPTNQGPVTAGCVRSQGIAVVY